jgi:uncharacterized protein YjbI with pentapeptide repeats
MELSVWTATQAPSMNGVVKNCRFNCGAIVLAGLRNVTLQDLTFTGKLANCNTLIDVSCGEQNAVGMVENVSFKNITVDNISGHYVDGNKNVHPMDCLIGGFEYIKNVSFDNVKIDCPTEMPNAFKYFSNATSAVQDVTLSNSSLSNVCSIWNIPNATITNTTFKNFKYALNAPGVTLKKCTFENSNVQKENAFSTGDILIYCRANSNVVIDGCTFEDTQSSPTTPQAIEIESSTKFTITNCKFLGPFTTGNALVMRGTCDAYKIVGNQHVQDQSKGV